MAVVTLIYQGYPPKKSFISVFGYITKSTLPKINPPSTNYHRIQMKHKIYPAVNWGGGGGGACPIPIPPMLLLLLKYIFRVRKYLLEIAAASLSRRYTLTSLYLHLEQIFSSFVNGSEIRMSI